MRLSVFVLSALAVIRAASAQEIRWMVASIDRPTSLVTYSNQVFVSGLNIATIQQWDMKEQRFVRTIGSHYHGGPVAVSPDGKFLVSVEGSYYSPSILWVWDLNTGSAHSIPNDG